MPATVLLISNFYYPEITGTAVYSTGLAEFLAESGYKVTVLTGFPNYPHWRTFSEYSGRLWHKETIRCVSVLRKRYFVPRPQALHTASKRGLYEFTFFAHGALAAASLRHNDLIVGVLPSLSCGVLARLFAGFYRSPYLLIYQDLTSAAARQAGIKGGLAVAPALEWAEGWVAKKAKGIGVIAEGFRHRLQRLGVPPHRIVRLRNWSDIPEPSDSRIEVRRRLGWEGKFICLHAGNMGYKQGLESVINAARTVKDDGQVQFVLMGDGNRRSALEVSVRDYELTNIEFLPIQSREDFPDILQAADALIVSQRMEVVDMALPSKLSAYFKIGLPVVCVASPKSEAAREVFNAGGGIIVDPGRPEDFVKAIVKLKEDDKYAQKLGSSARAYATANLSREKTLHEWERFIASGFHPPH